MKKVFTLLTLLVAMATSAWGDDYVSATQTFKTKTVARDSCEWSELKAVVAKNTSQSGDGLYFTAGGSNISNTSGAFGSSAWIIYLQVPSASSNGYVTMVSNSDATDRPLYLNTYNSETKPEAKLVCQKNGSRIAFTADDVVKIGDNYYLQLSNTDKKDVKIKTIGILLNDESYPEIVKENPVFSLTKTSITTAQTSQIQVGTKGSLDGITFDGDVTFGTDGVVTVDADGVVTPVAAGTTTINFNSSASSKYNESTGNSLTITVTEAITVFDGAGVKNQEILLTLDNVNDKDYISTNAADKFADKDWTGYEGKYLDMKTGRTISITVKNVSSFEFYLSGTKDRTFTVKVGSADAKEYTQSNSSGFVSSGVISTGTMGEVTIVIEGGSKTLYPVYFKVNPAIELTPAKAQTTYVTTYALDFSSVDGLKAYVATGSTTTTVEMVSVDVVPAGTPLILKGTAATEYTVPVVASASAPATNYLVAGPATINASTASESRYVLSGGLFKKVVTDGVNIPAGKCYLQLDESGLGSSASSLEMNFSEENEDNTEDNTTGIETIDSSKTSFLDGDFYNLSGQRVAQPTKGLYIVNGKKVIVK